jgi:hypothetical protein
VRPSWLDAILLVAQSLALAGRFRCLPSDRLLALQPLRRQASMYRLLLNPDVKELGIEGRFFYWDLPPDTLPYIQEYQITDF